MIKDFQTWHTIKWELENKNQNYLFNEREIWWCSVGENIWFEQDGKNDMFERPVLILKKFNHDMFFWAPLTSSSKLHPMRYPYKINETEGSINLSQCRTWSAKRLLRKITKMWEDSFAEILNIFQQQLLYKAKAPLEVGQSRVPDGKKW